MMDTGPRNKLKEQYKSSDEFYSAILPVTTLKSSMDRLKERPQTRLDRSNGMHARWLVLFYRPERLKCSQP